MIELANQKVKECDGNVVFIKNSHNDTYSVSFDIRAICMDAVSYTHLDVYKRQAIFISGNLLFHPFFSQINHIF